MARVLAIEDEENLRFSIRQSLTKQGHDVVEAASIPAAWDQIRQSEFDAVITDVNLNGGETGIDLLKGLRDDGFDGAIVVITAFGTIEKAVDAMKYGADDYLQKPISLEELTLVIDRVLEHRRLRSRVQLYERMEQSRIDQSDTMIGETDAWKHILELGRRLSTLPLPDKGSAPGNLPTVLIVGETGAGKGVLARFIHEQAQHAPDSGADGPFVHVNCSALPAALVESELFGHEKGAFTDAKSARTGLFEMAEGGTIFLDEIGDMPADLQAKLLLVVEQGTFRRVGGTKERRVCARVIAATNQDLEERVESGEFRSDLYYRLNAFTVSIPPLRDRREDIIAIADATLDRFRREYRRPDAFFNAQAIAALKHHEWPGNVRELINAVQRAVMLSDADEIGPLSLGLNPSAQRKAACALQNGTASRMHDDDGSLVFDFEHNRYTAEDVEKQLIMQALRTVKGNVSRAAKLIGMNRSSLRYRIERSGLEEYVRDLAEK